METRKRLNSAPAQGLTNKRILAIDEKQSISSAESISAMKRNVQIADRRDIKFVKINSLDTTSHRDDRFVIAARRLPVLIFSALSNFKRNSRFIVCW